MIERSIINSRILVQKIFVFWIFIFIPFYSLYSGGIDLGLGGARGPYLRGAGMWIICLDCILTGSVFLAWPFFGRPFPRKFVIPALSGFAGILGLGILVWLISRL